MATTKKSRPEPDLLPPLNFHAPSNGEFCPLPPSRRAVEAEQRWLAMVETKHRRLGMTRRAFANSSCGMAAALLAINQAACSSAEKSKASGGTTSGGCGPDGCGTTSGGFGGGSGTGSGAGTTSTLGGAGGFMVDDDMTEDMDMADEMMSGNEFILDVQTHVSTPIAEPWDDGPPDERALDYITQIFVQSETAVAVLSGIPATRALGAPETAARNQMRELIQRLGGTRLLIHGNAEPERGAAELDYMSELAGQFPLSAWKVYPHEGSLLLDSDELGPPFVARARELGVLLVAAHRGIWDDAGYAANASPADVVRTAAAAPDLNFLVYHSGYESTRDENHPYDPNAADQFGVDRMVKALEDSGIGPGGNVYAELGSTWANIMTDPEQAAHVLGKLLKVLGPDRILWGTDSVFNGIPQSQIVAFRMFQIPEAMQLDHGYPALSQAIKDKIFGLNAARIYNVDVSATRTAISEDDVADLRMALLDDPRSVPVPDRRRYEGPRTRREFFELLKRDSFFRHG